MKDNNLKKKLRNILLKHFNLKKDFKNQININTVESWDSFAHLALMSEIEKNFNFNLNDNEILSLHSEKSILKTLKKRFKEKK